MSISQRCNTNELLNMQKSMNVEHVLNEVPDDLQVLALDICNTLQTLRPYEFIQKISCVTHKTGFEIVATIQSTDAIVSIQDLQTIMDVNPTRIAFTSVKLVDQCMCIAVRVSSTSQPLVLTDVQITHIRKKQKWFSD
jgi:hypothetical protein